MHTFKAGGRVWSVEVNVGTIKTVKRHLGIDLYKLVDDGFEGLDKLLSDPCDLVDVIYVLCMEQAKAGGVSDEDFGRSFAGDALFHATEAFLAEYTDFFPDPRARAGLTKLMEKGRKAQTVLMMRLDAEIDKANPEEMADLAAKLWKSTSGGSQGGSASTPPPSRSANSS